MTLSHAVPDAIAAFLMFIPVSDNVTLSEGHSLTFTSVVPTEIYYFLFKYFFFPKHLTQFVIIYYVFYLLSFLFPFCTRTGRHHISWNILIFPGS